VCPAAVARVTNRAAVRLHIRRLKFPGHRAGGHRRRAHHVRPQLARRAQIEGDMRRRDFLSALSLAPVFAAARLPQTTAAPPAPHGLKLGTVTYNIAKDWDIPTIIANLTEAGFDAVELRTTHQH